MLLSVAFAVVVVVIIVIVIVVRGWWEVVHLCVYLFEHVWNP